MRDSFSPVAVISQSHRRSKFTRLDGWHSLRQKLKHHWQWFTSHTSAYRVMSHSFTVRQTLSVWREKADVNTLVLLTNSHWHPMHAMWCTVGEQNMMKAAIRLFHPKMTVLSLITPLMTFIILLNTQKRNCCFNSFLPWIGLKNHKNIHMTWTVVSFCMDQTEIKVIMQWKSSPSCEPLVNG